VGRLLSVLPRIRGEDDAFHAAVSEGRIARPQVHDCFDDERDPVDPFGIAGPAAQCDEGHRLI
jgi:hypothetical protein